MRRHMKSILCYLLTITILFTHVPIVSNAAVWDSETEPLKASERASSSEEAQILYELVDKRDETTKHFAMSDGSTKAFIYPQHVHFLKDGKYKEIDNTLQEVTEGDITYYQNKKNGFRVRIPENLGEEYIEFSDDNGYVRFQLQGATNKKIENVGKDNHPNKKDITIVKNVNDKAVFKKAKGDVDLEYDLAGNKLKETIVLYKKSKQSFVFEIQTDAESAVLNNDNSVSFFNEEGVEIYHMEKPYMTDAQGEYSNEVATKLIRAEEGYYLTYTPDYEWLSAKERQYPVRIDPTLVQAIYTETVTDTYVSNGQKTSAPDIRGGWDVLNIGRRRQTFGSVQYIKRGFIRFEVPSEIGKNDCIIDAKLDLVHYTVPDAVSVNGIQIDVHELTSGFTEGGTYWVNQPGYNPVVTDYAIVNKGNTFPGSSLSYDSYNLTKLVNKWHNGEPNYGILLKLHDEDVTVTSNRQVFYFARQSAYYKSVSKFVEITYRNTNGLESYWNYTTQDLGEYGAGYINNYNGNLVYVHEDRSYNSLIDAFTLAHVYNGSNAEKGNSLQSNLRYGMGWNLNFIQMLYPVTVSGNSHVKYKYVDGDGTEHYFVQLEDGSIVDEDGLGYTFGTISEGELIYSITTKDKIVLKFDQWYYLRESIDANGNKITLTYDTETGDRVLSRISASTGGNVSLIYDGDNRLYQVWDDAARHLEYEYSADGTLTRIHYPEGTATSYDTYTSLLYEGNRLKSITIPGGRSVNYTYSNGRVVSTFEKGIDGSVGQTLALAYDQNQTKITDAQGRTLTYQFDTWGRPTCVYDENQNIYSQTYTPKITTGEEIRNNHKLATSSGEVTYVDNMLTNGLFVNDLDGWTVYWESENAERGIVEEGLLTPKSVRIISGENSTEAIMQTPVLTQERTYTFSGYFKTENIISEEKGVALEVVTTLGRVFYSDFLTGTTDTQINQGYQRLDVTFTLEENEGVNRLTAGMYCASGVVYIDSLQLEEGNTANAINLIENSGFERNSGSGTIPNGFGANYGDATGSSVNTSISKSGTASFAVVGSGGLERCANQYRGIGGKTGDVYSVGAWVKADAVPNHKADTENEADFAMHVYVYYGNSYFQHEIIRFNEYVSDWQYASKVFKIKQDYTGIGIYCNYDHNANVAYFDNLFLYRDTMQSYTYDKKGNVVSTSDYASQKSSFEYNDDTLARLITPTGTGYEYLYDEKGNLVGAKSSEGIGYDISVDTYGNPTSASVEKQSYSTTVEDGKVYYIRSKRDGKYLAVSDGGEGTNVVESDYYEWDYLKWKAVSAGDGYYFLMPQHATDMGLDTTGGENNEGTNIQIYTKNDSSAQKFKIVPQSDYTYKLIPQCSTDGKVVTVNHGTTVSNVTLASEQSGENICQNWFFDPVDVETSHVEDGIYRLRIRSSAEYVETIEETYDDGSGEIYTWDYAAPRSYDHTSNNQKFIIKEYENSGYYTIAPLSTPDRYLTVGSQIDEYWNWELIELGNNVISDSKLFRFVYNTSSGGWLINTKTDEMRCIGVYTSSGNQYIMADWDVGGWNQTFVLERVSETISTSATYYDGRFLRTITDTLGGITEYFYDHSRGLQTGVRDAKGNSATYNYHALNDRLQSVTNDMNSVYYQYNAEGAITRINLGSGTSYQFSYDSLGRMTQVAIGDVVLSSTTYENLYSSLVKRFTYGNGDYLTYAYDNQDRVISESVNGVEKRNYVYDKQGNVARVHDLMANLVLKMEYDLIGRAVGMKSSDGQSMQFVYDEYNRVSRMKWNMGDMSVGYAYLYGDRSVEGQVDSLIYGVSINGTEQLTYEYDELTRIKKQTIQTTTPFETEYTYLEGAVAGTTTTLVKTLRNEDDTYSYTYDAVGNITSVQKNGVTIETYTYDEMYQLVGATYGGNTYSYEYDMGGNLISVYENGDLVKQLGYSASEWSDLLVGVNDESIVCDEIGNPTTYLNGLGFTWQNGRELATVTKNGQPHATYLYNADGLRTSKNVNGTVTNFYWMNGVLQAQQTGNEYLYFLYNESGTAFGFILKNDTVEERYYYEFNLQGDIIGIVDAAGNRVVSYTYGAWGDILSVTGTLADSIGQKNPFRYRGYYYDAETEFYYLITRYYNAEIGRFISSDSIEYLGTDGSTLSYNLFLYCKNNPINKLDIEGNFAISAIGWAALNVIVNVGASYLAAKATGQEYTWVDAGIDATTAFIGSFGGYAIGIAAIIDGGITAYQNYKEGYDIKTSLLLGGITALGSVCTINTYLDIQKIGVETVTTIALETTLGTGTKCTTAAVEASVKKNSVKRNTTNIPEVPSIVTRAKLPYSRNYFKEKVWQ